MAFTGSNHLCSTFKKELLEGTHNFANGGNSFKLALFTNSQAGNNGLGGTSTDMDATITLYHSDSSNEVANSGDYVQGGTALGSQAVSGSQTQTTAFVDFADKTFGSATITARGALIYNDTNSDKAVCVLDFGSDKSSSSGNFTIVFPSADTSSAIIRIA